MKKLKEFSTLIAISSSRPAFNFSKKTKDKIGFITSEENWVKKEFSVEFREMLNRSIAASKGIIKQDALQYFDKVVAGDVPFTYNYWRLIQFGLWMQIFKVEL